MYLDVIGTNKDPILTEERYLQGLEYSQRAVQAAWIDRYGADGVELITGPVSGDEWIDTEDLDSHENEDIEEFELSETEITKLHTIQWLAERRDFRESMRVWLAECDTKERLMLLVDYACLHDERYCTLSGWDFWDTYTEMEDHFLMAEDRLTFKPCFVKIGTLVLKAFTEEQYVTLMQKGAVSV